jgi:hypothetical protein
LYKAFEVELEAGRADVDRLLADGLSKRLREANLTALIWVSKNRWGWCDRVEQQGKNEVDLSIQIKPEELPKLLEANGLPPMILGRDVPTIDGPRQIEHNGLAHDDAGAGSDG